MNGVSVVICCYNSSDRIITTLRHLQKQELNNSVSWEVIVVDNASTDNTSIVAAEVWKENPVTAFRIVSEEKPGLMRARHKGFAEAKFEIVSFVDDDNWVEVSWVEKLYKVFSSDDKIGVCGSSSDAVFEKTKPEWFHLYENSFAVGKQSEESGVVDDKKGFLWGAGLSCRKSLWNELQNRGFKNLTIGREGINISAGEDTELCYAFRLLGYRLYYSDELTLKHFIPAGRMNFSYLEKMNVGFGKSNVRLNCYRGLLNPGNFKLRSWWYESAVAIKKIMKLSISIFFTSDQKEKQMAKVNRAYWKGYALQMMQDRGNLNLMIEEIKKVFKLI